MLILNFLLIIKHAYKFIHVSIWDKYHKDNVERNLKSSCRTSLVIQWIRICLPMQGTWVWSLVQEDPTCCRATKAHALEPLSCNYWAHKLQLLKPTCHNYWAWMLQLWKPMNLEPVATREALQWEAHIQQRVASAHQTRKSLYTATKTQCNQK